MIFLGGSGRNCKESVMNRESLGYTVVFTFIVTFAMAIGLSVAHSSTVELVELNELERRKSTILASIGLDSEIMDTETIFATYGSLDQIAEGGPGLYMYNDGGEPIITRQFSGPGVWGDIVAVVSVNADVSRIVGVEILDHNETPGLGGRVTSEAFLTQLRGERIGPEGVTVVIRGPGDEDKDNAQIDGITGASGTTRAFDRMLNAELRALRELIEQDRVSALPSS
jgi:Na+-transporting NADH:ubiquinone oxidoreductase subunit C